MINKMLLNVRSVKGSPAAACQMTALLHRQGSMWSLFTRIPGRIFSTAKTTSWCNRYGCRKPQHFHSICLILISMIKSPRSVFVAADIFCFTPSFFWGQLIFTFKRGGLGLKQRSQLAFTCFCGAPEATVALRWRPKPTGRRHSQQFTPTRLVYKHKCVVYLMLHNMHMLQFVFVIFEMKAVFLLPLQRSWPWECRAHIFLPQCSAFDIPHTDNCTYFTLWEKCCCACTRSLKHSRYSTALNFSNPSLFYWSKAGRRRTE